MPTHAIPTRSAAQECEFELRSFKGVAEKVLLADIEAFDKGLDPLASLPPHLQNVRQDRAVAEDRLQRATVLKARIEKEVKDTEAQLAAADKHVMFAAHAAAIALARTLALELDDFEQAAHNLRQRIVSLQMPGQSVPDDLIRRAFAPPKPVKGTDEDKAAWAGLLARLSDDPNADMA